MGEMGWGEGDGGRAVANSSTPIPQTNKVLQPLELLNIVDVPTGSGIMFMSTLAAASGNLNFLEGVLDGRGA